MIEVYCGYNYRKDKDLPVPNFCSRGMENPGFHCLENNCEFFSYTDCPFEIAYAGEYGEITSEECWIGFGGEMEPEDEKKRKILISHWEDICKKKIEEAYDEYMELKENIYKAVITRTPDISEF